MALVKINQNCVGCQKCVDVCSANVLKMNDNKAIVAKPEVCIGCAHCAVVCPVGAISSTEHRKSFKINDISSEQLVSAALKQKRSVRRYKELPINDELINDIIEHANYAPSATNTRERKYIVISDRNLLQKIEDAIMKVFTRVLRYGVPVVKLVNNMRSQQKREQLGNMLEHMADVVANYQAGKQPMLRGAPLAIVFLGKKSARLASDDAIIAQQYAMLRAHELGIGSCIIGFAVVARRFINKLLPIPKEYEIKAFSVFGYAMHDYDKAVQYDHDAELIKL